MRSRALALAMLLALPAGAAPLSARRLAVLVGANAAPPGRQTLRFAHRDATTLRDALERVGGVAPGDAILLLDPEPAEVIAALDRLSAVARAETRETVLVFYYSGHADDVSLYPRGTPLAIETVRRALLEGGATVRVGIFDACRGGAWTRAKGLSAAPPVELRPPWTLAAEGTVLFASSSGLEEAHESDRLQASFFTHHLVGGLLGAADTSGDGTVTATEAFQYAQARTVRDSARASAEPQHPSFELNLHGRKDLVLAQLEVGSSTLTVEQASGPLQIIELPQGLVLVEIPEGRRSTRLSVPPGDYLIRRVDGAGVVTAREVQVAAGQPTTVEESSLVLVGDGRLESKGDTGPPRVQESILPLHRFGVSFGMGVDYVPLNSQGGGYDGRGVLRLNVAWSPLNWLEVSFLLPGVSVLLGNRLRDEVVLSGGLDEIGYDGRWLVTPAVGAAYRHWFSGSTSIGPVARWSNRYGAATNDPEISGSVLLTHTIRDVVSLNFALGATSWSSGPVGITFGSGLVGFRAFPLVRLHLSPAWAIDLDARITLQVHPETKTVQQYLLGFSAVW
jgi:hypothetical protein